MAEKAIRAKGMGLKQLLAKKYKELPNLPEKITNSFGELTQQILMIIYGASGNGKSRLVMEMIKPLMEHGNVLYWGLEEGHRKTMQKNAKETLNPDDHSGKIIFFDHTLTLEGLREILKKKKSPWLVVMDSLQYARMTIEEYKRLKEDFPNKGFIFISHNSGKKPMGKLAVDIEFDVDIKVRVEGYIAFVKSRYGGNKPYVIWEEGARKYWGKKFRNIIK